MFKSMETIRAEEEARHKIMRAARKLMILVDSPVLMVCKDGRGMLHLWKNTEPFQDAMDFDFQE